MRFRSSGVLLCAVFLFASEVLPGDESSGAPSEPLVDSYLELEGTVLRREVLLTDDKTIEYVILVRPTVTDPMAEEPLFVKTSSAEALGTLIDGKQVLLVLDPLSDGSYRLIDAEVSSALQAVTTSGQRIPGAEPELLIDGLVDTPGSSWASPSSPNWVEIDFGQSRILTEVSMSPFFGSPAEPYFYNEGWSVEYRDRLGELHDFSSVEMFAGRGTMVGPGIHIVGGDPGTSDSEEEYKHYRFRFDPIETRYLRYTVNLGDREGSSNGAELGFREAFLVGTPVTLVSDVDEPAESELTTATNWSSDLDGFLGSGASITVDTLSVGTHTITALVDDGERAQASSTMEITILEELPATYVLTVAKDGEGTGTIRSSPEGIDCGTDCGQVFDEGSAVTLTATPDTDSEFVGWAGDEDCVDGQLTMEADRACIATFEATPPDSFSLVVSKTGSGTGTVSSTPAGIDCGADCEETFEQDTLVSLVSNPDPGSILVETRGHADCSDGEVTMTGDRECTVQFDLESHPLRVVMAGTGSGTVTSDPSGIECGEDCSEEYPYETSVTLSATPNPGSIFNGWSGHEDCADGTLTLTSARDCTATFDLESRTLLVATAGSGSGQVTSSPAGIQCGTDCSEDYDNGTQITLAATPAVDSRFVGWSGDADCADGSVTLTQDLACTATFELLPPTLYTLKIFKTGSGNGTVTSSPAGIDCGSDCIEDFEDGSAVTLTATPDADSEFTGWSGDADCADGSVTVSQATTCTATFDLLPPTLYTLKIFKTGSGSGSVTSSPAGIDCGSDCIEDYEEGTAVALIATADEGSVFEGWSGPDDCMDGSVVMIEARSCIATFNLEPYTLTVSTAGSGTGFVTSSPAGISCGATCSHDFPDGTVVRLTPIADAGSDFVGWSGDTDCADGSVTMNQARSCTATFEPTPPTEHLLTIDFTGAGSGAVKSTPAGIACDRDCSNWFSIGAMVTLSATSAPGSVFLGWSGQQDCKDGVVTMTGSRECLAVFEKTSDRVLASGFNHPSLSAWTSVIGQVAGLCTASPDMLLASSDSSSTATSCATSTASQCGGTTR